ncbi:hypothetical protein [Nocardia aurea]|uniref:Uncharacterized protein n=1 Tax=Nocardia aurea TaxID=2144174 RepID=A0ABV3FQ09_9NOCA
MSSDEKEIAALESQVLKLGEEIHAYTLSTDKYFTVATTVVVAAITLKVANKFPAAVIALPFALAGLLMYVMQLYTERAARIGIKASLEVALQHKSGYWFVRKTAALDEAVNQDRASVRWSTGLYGLGYLASCAFAFIDSWRLNLSGWMHIVVPYTILGLLLLLFIPMLTAMLELARARGKGEAHISSIQPAPPTGGP